MEAQDRLRPLCTRSKCQRDLAATSAAIHTINHHNKTTSSSGGTEIRVRKPSLISKVTKEVLLRGLCLSAFDLNALLSTTEI